MSRAERGSDQDVYKQGIQSLICYLMSISCCELTFYGVNIHVQISCSKWFVLQKIIKKKVLLLLLSFFGEVENLFLKFTML